MAEDQQYSEQEIELYCGSAGKESACNVGDLGWFLGWEDPLEKGMATHSSILAWGIPWTVSSMGLQRVGHDWATFTFFFLYPLQKPLSSKFFSSYQK